MIKLDWAIITAAAAGRDWVTPTFASWIEVRRQKASNGSRRGGREARMAVAWLANWPPMGMSLSRMLAWASSRAIWASSRLSRVVDITSILADLGG